MRKSRDGLDVLIERIPQALWLFLTLVAACVILYTGMRPGAELKTVSSLPRGFDKALHFTAYAAMTVCFFRGIFPVSLRRSPMIDAPWCWLIIPALPALVGLIDEICQGFTPGRSSDWRDWIADFTAGLFILTLGIIYRKKK